ARRLALALVAIRLHHLLEVVNVVYKSVVELVDGRLDVARNGDIHEKDGAVPARGEQFLRAFLCNYKVRRARRADDDVGLVDIFEKLLEMDRGAVKRLGEFLRALVGAVADKDGARAAAQQMLRGQLAHLARADHKDRLAVKRAEDFLGQLDRRVRDGDGRGADGSLTAHTPRHGQGVADDFAERAVERARAPRRGVSLFHLAEHLRLAEDHRIEARGDAEQVPHGVELFQPVEM